MPPSWLEKPFGRVVGIVFLASLLAITRADSEQHDLCAALLIGATPCPTIPLTVAHFSSYLGPSIPLFVYRDSRAEAGPLTLPGYARRDGTGGETVGAGRSPTNVTVLQWPLASSEDLSRIITDTAFWSAIPCAKILLFQGIICT